jgi:hypothetical protein
MQTGVAIIIIESLPASASFFLENPFSAFASIENCYRQSMGHEFEKPFASLRTAQLGDTPAARIARSMAATVSGDGLKLPTR